MTDDSSINGLFSNESTVSDSANDSVGNEEQELDSETTVNDQVSYTDNSNNF